MNNTHADLLVKAAKRAYNAIAIYSNEGRFEWINEGFTNLTGFTSDEVIGKRSTEVFEKLIVKEEPIFFPEQSFAEDTPESSVQEIYCNRKDGPHYWAKVGFSPIFTEQGEVKHFVAIYTEISDKKELLLDLSKQVQQNEKILSSLNEGYILVDEYANIRDANPAYCSIVGYTKEELLSMKLTDLRPGMTEEYQKEFIESVIKEGAKKFETRHRTKEGEMVDLEATAAAIKKGETLLLAGFVWDVTDRKEAQRRLEESEQKWQHLVEDNPQPVQVTINGKIVFINEAGAKLYGAEEPNEIIGMSVFAFSHPNYMNEIKASEDRVKKGLSDEGVYEHKIVLLNGETRYVEVHSIPVNYQGEDAIQTVLYDVTDRKRRERMIEASLVEKEVLLKEIHHRVKNNMAVISGLLELQAMNTSDSNLKVLLKESQLRIASMAMIHEKLYQNRTFAEIEFREYVRELVKSIADTISVSTKEIAISYNLESIRLNINQAIPAALILNEAVVNSYKHAFEGKNKGNIEICLFQNKDEVTLKIEDDGIGLPENFEIEKQRSLGTTLIKTLTKQLHGDLSLAGPSDSDSSGTCIEVRFKQDN